jgi:predicted phosphohydrolase
MTRIVCISDTHTYHSKIVVPDGDILIHAGDATFRGSVPEIAEFNKWLGSLPHKHKLICAGNHDWGFERTPEIARNLITNAVYLEDQEITVEGLRVYMSPWQPEFCNWAFNLPRGEDLREVWAKIPEGIDVLVTHGPPMGILDFTHYDKKSVGCADLLTRIRHIKPKLHVFGHIHEGYGVIEKEGTKFVNASICTLSYKPSNPPIVVDL